MRRAGQEGGSEIPVVSAANLGSWYSCKERIERRSVFREGGILLREMWFYLRGNGKVPSASSHSPVHSLTGLPSAGPTPEKR